MQEHFKKIEIDTELLTKLETEGISPRTFCSVTGIGDPTLNRDYGDKFTYNTSRRIPLEDARSLARKIEEDRKNKQLSKRRKELAEGLLPYWEILLDQP